MLEGERLVSRSFKAPTTGRLTTNIGSDEVGYTNDLLHTIRQHTAADLTALKEARYRRDLVIGFALKLNGVRRGYKSGSIAHGTAKTPLSDADGGVVLDRRYYPSLGPDGVNVGPTQLLEDVRDFIGGPIREQYPKARLTLLKRAIKVTFAAPIDEDQDPSVDLIVGLERKDEPGLWIPNTIKDAWNPSNPELHTSMILEANKVTNNTFARTIRLAKLWNDQYAVRTVIPFNFEALALASIAEEKNLATALLQLFDHAAKQVKRGNTPDPAGASAAIKLPDNQTRDNAVRRLEKATTALQTAMDHDADETIVLEALQGLFWDYQEILAAGLDKARLMNVLRSGNGAVRFGESLTFGASATGRTVKDTRAYGDPLEDSIQPETR